jgi:hypothetical protein
MDRWLRGSVEFGDLSAQHCEAAQATHPDGSSGDYDLNARALAATEAAIEMLPEVLGIVLAIARTGAAPPSGTRRGGGRSQDVFRRELFAGLAGTAEAMFGRQPRARDKAGYPNPQALAWARQLLDIAAERIQAAFNGDSASAIAHLEMLRAAEDATLAKHIEGGQRAWKRRQRRTAP